MVIRQEILQQSIWSQYKLLNIDNSNFHLSLVIFYWYSTLPFHKQQRSFASIIDVINQSCFYLSFHDFNFNISYRTMRDPLSWIVPLLVVIIAKESHAAERKWILAADPTESPPFWNQHMPRRGSDVSWWLRQSQNQTVFKLTLSETKHSNVFLQIKMIFNSSDAFSTEIYQATSPAHFTFYTSSHISKRWSSDPDSLGVTVNNRKTTISGKDFYLWITLNSKSSVNYPLVLAFLALLLIKTEINFGVQSRFASPELIAPGLLIFFIIFWRGVGYALESIVFESPWEYSLFAGYSLLFYIYLPYGIKIFNILQNSSQCLQKSLKVRLKYLEYVITPVVLYLIFVQVSVFAISLVAILETVLLFVLKQRSISMFLLFFYLADILILFGLNFIEICPQQYQFGTNSLLLMPLFFSFQFWGARRSKENLGSNQKSPLKKAK